MIWLMLWARPAIGKVSMCTFPPFCIAHNQFQCDIMRIQYIIVTEGESRISKWIHEHRQYLIANGVEEDVVVIKHFVW